MRLRRRTVLSAAGLGALGATPRFGFAREQKPRFKVADDGTFDLVWGDLTLVGCFPAFDDVPIHPRQVVVERAARRTDIQYELVEGSFRLALSHDADSVVIESNLTGFAVAPHHVFPLAGARVMGANRFFKQGLGFGGPSGVFSLPASEKWHDPNHLREGAWSYDSYLSTALLSPSGDTLVLGAAVHRDYLQRSTLYNRTHRQQLVDKLALTDMTMLDVGFATERIPCNGRSLALPAIHVRGGQGAWEPLSRHARHMALVGKARVDKPIRYNWDTWYEFLDDYDQNRLDEVLAGLDRLRPGVRIEGVVIDAGYCFLGDWTRAGPPQWPGGLPEAFERIKQAGLQVGAYVGPYMVSNHSEFYRQHPDAVIHGLDGKPLVHGVGKPIIDNRSLSETRYFLDSSHPAGFAHLREVFRTLRKWGATFYKTDFWEWGFKDSTQVKRNTTGKTSVQYMTDVLDMVRAEIGEESHLIGCIAPLGPFIGQADSMRVGYDTEPGGWKPDGNMVNMFNETHAAQYFNNVLWQNDPDVVYLRATTNPLNEHEMKALALWSGILGGVVCSSDRLHLLQPERLALLRFIQPGAQKQTARMPFWYDGRKERIAVRDYPDGASWAILVVNTTEEALQFRLPLEQAVGRPQAHCFRWEPGRALALGNKRVIEETLQPHHSVLYYVSRVNQPPAASMALSGERMTG